MNKRTIMCLVGLIVVIGVSSAFATGSPKYRSSSQGLVRDNLMPVGGPEADAVGTFPRPSRGTAVSVGAAAPSPGTRMGQTAYDYQHNGATGRQVDQFNGRIQTSWMKGLQLNPSFRQIQWNEVSVTGGPTPVVLDNGESSSILTLGIPGTVEGIAAITGNRPGYTTFRNKPDGRGVVFAHDSPEDGSGSSWLLALDLSVGGGVYTQSAFAPQPVDVVSGQEPIWPHGCISIVGTDTVAHGVCAEFNIATDQKMWYWRGVLSGTAVTWSSEYYIDSVSTLSYVMEANPLNDDITVVYAKPRTLGTQTNNDIAYRRSTDGGLSWGPIVNITNYTEDSTNRAYFDVDALYDEDGTFHIIYNTLFYDPDAGQTFVQPNDLVHWNDLRGTNRTILTAEWSNTCNSQDQVGNGQFGLLLAKPNLTVKPAGAGPGAGIADELVYAVWSQFGPTDTDCSMLDSTTANGWVNGEIWCSVSSNDGLTWDRPTNLTGTETPDCLPNDCHSEHWVTAAARADSGLYISYVDDTHAGSSINSEGIWTFSNYMVMAVETRTPLLEPRIGVSPQNFIELNVDTTGSQTVTVFIDNLGNSDLTYSVVVTNDNGGGSHVLVNGSGTFGSAIVAAGPTESLTIEVDGLGLGNPSENNWRVEVTSNDPSNDPGQGGTAIDINLNVFVANPWFTCVGDTISTGTRLMAISSCLELGDQGTGGGLLLYADSSEWLYDASPILVRLDGGTKRAHRDIFYNNLIDRSRATNQAYRAQTATSVARDVMLSNGEDMFLADQATGVATTTDSLIQLDWSVTTFKAPDLSDGAVMRYQVTNRTGSTISGIALGAGADLDVDSSSGDNDGIASDPKQYVGAQGGYSDTSMFFPQTNFMALFHIPLDESCTETAAGGLVTDNVDYVYPGTAGFESDSLYDIFNEPQGWNSDTRIQDTITDVNVLLVSKQNVDLGANDTVNYAFGMVVSDVSISDLEEKMAFLRAAVNSSCIAGCPILKTGDVNLSTTITSADIIYLVGYVFKGGADPMPCAASGDVNCSNTVTSADIIYLVGFVFKGGDPPCDACASTLAGDC